MNPVFENLTSLTFNDIHMIVDGKPVLAKEFIQLARGMSYNYYEYMGSTCVISLVSDENHKDEYYFVAADAAGCFSGWMTDLDRRKKHTQFHSHKEKVAFFAGVMGDVTW